MHLSDTLRANIRIFLHANYDAFEALDDVTEELVDDIHERSLDYKKPPKKLRGVPAEAGLRKLMKKLRKATKKEEEEDALARLRDRGAARAAN